MAQEVLPVEHGAAYLQQAMGSATGPSHVPVALHPLTHDVVDCRLGACRRDEPLSALP